MTPKLCNGAGRKSTRDPHFPRRNRASSGATQNKDVFWAAMPARSIVPRGTKGGHGGTGRAQRRSSRGHTTGTATWRARRLSSHGDHGEPRRTRREEERVRRSGFGVRSGSLGGKLPTSRPGLVDRSLLRRRVPRKGGPRYTTPPNPKPRAPNPDLRTLPLPAVVAVVRRGRRVNSVAVPAV